MNRLEGKIAVVTGASSGIGQATAELFVHEGATVVIAARRIERLEELKNKLEAQGGKVAIVATDVSMPEDCRNLIKTAIDVYNRIDVLVNCAGIDDRNRSITTTDEDFYTKVIATNQNSIFHLCKAVLPHMEQQGSGSVVNVSSVAGVKYNSGISYTASKSAVVAMTKNLAIQYGGSGIRINCLCPGMTLTEIITEENLKHFDQDFMAVTGAYFRDEVGITEAIDQANAILFFASDESRYVTGQYLTVDRGMFG